MFILFTPWDIIEKANKNSNYCKFLDVFQLSSKFLIKPCQVFTQVHQYLNWENNITSEIAWCFDIADLIITKYNVLWGSRRRQQVSTSLTWVNFERPLLKLNSIKWLILTNSSVSGNRIMSKPFESFCFYVMVTGIGNIIRIGSICLIFPETISRISVTGWKQFRFL